MGIGAKQVRNLIVIIIGLVGAFFVAINPNSYEERWAKGEELVGDIGGELVVEMLGRLEVKGRAPKTGYSREKFYKGWPKIDGCSLRQRILKREFGERATLSGCEVVAGSFFEPYLGEWREFKSKKEIAKGLQIDHIVALSDAWQKGAQYKSEDVRYKIATDPLNLVAADGPANMEKGDADAASWLPKNKSFRCQYVGRQVAVKKKYGLWVTRAEKEAMEKVMGGCSRYRVRLW